MVSHLEDTAMSALDPRSAVRLAKRLGMLGSEHPGERATAGAMADELVRANGLSWQQVISIKPPTPSVEDQIDFALRNGILSAWELGFLSGIRRHQFLTEK